MSISGRNSKSAFWSGVLTIFGSQLAVKLLGLVYRLVITNIDGYHPAEVNKNRQTE